MSILWLLTILLIQPPPKQHDFVQSEPWVRTIRSFESALRTAVDNALLEVQKSAKSDALTWIPPEVESFELPLPTSERGGSLLFVVRVPSLVSRLRNLRADVNHTAIVRNALLDAVVDNAAALPLAEDNWLTVVAAANGSETALSNHYQLYLAIKGADVARLATRGVTREAARKLISVVEQF